MRLTLKNKIEVFDCQIVFAHLHSQKPAVVVAGIIVGVNIKGNIVIIHGTAQIILAEPRHSPVQIEAGFLGRLHYSTIVCLFRIGKGAMIHLEHATCAQSVNIVGINLQSTFNQRVSTDRVGALKGYLSFQHVASRVRRPLQNHGVKQSIGRCQTVQRRLTKNQIVPNVFVIITPRQQQPIVV